MFTEIRLQNYRLYNDASYTFSEGVNLITGPNASGKTSLLEAVYMAAQGKSFRGRDADIIKHNKPWTRVDADVADKTRTIKIKKGSIKSEKILEFSTDDKYARMPAKYVLPVVLFTPDHLRLIDGSPTRRREYLDKLIIQLNPTRRPTYSRYLRALKQRNALLKTYNPDRDELFVWGIKLAEYGSRIVAWRQDLIKELNKYASQHYSELADKRHEVEFEYVCDIDANSNYTQSLTAHLQGGRDILAGFTAQGPHRDDLTIKIDSHPSSTHASRGEARTLVLAAKETEAQLIIEHTKTKPTLLLDDVFGDLDAKRRHQLSKWVKNYQTFITTAEQATKVKLKHKSVIVIKGEI